MAAFIRLQNGAIGCNIAEMEGLAAAFKNAVPQVEQVFKTLDNQIGRTTWAGNDATKSEAQWNQTRAQITKTLQSLMEQMAQAITAQQRDQGGVSNN